MQIYYPDGNGGRKLIDLGGDIPTMSESVKGGAKLGEGLEIKDETLNAPFSSQIPNLINRVAQSETNISNLFMFLDSAIENLEANLLIFEDFKDNRFLDTLKTKVLNTVGGPNDVYVESLDGILIGHWYVLSDGNHSKFLRVQAIACNAGVYDVMFEEPIGLTFNLKKTYLYRTTGKVAEGVITGAATVKERKYSFHEAWSGEASSTPKTLSLTTTQAKISNFDLSGDYAFDKSGFFTLT